MNYLNKSLFHPDVSGFELLEILDIRSQLAFREPLMDDNEKAELEKSDRQLSQFADYWAARIAEVADLAEMRKKEAKLQPIFGRTSDHDISTSRSKTLSLQALLSTMGIPGYPDSTQQPGSFSLLNPDGRDWNGWPGCFRAL